MVTFYLTATCHFPEDTVLHTQCGENLTVLYDIHISFLSCFLFDQRIFTYV